MNVARLLRVRVTGLGSPVLQLPPGLLVSSAAAMMPQAFSEQVKPLTSYYIAVPDSAQLSKAVAFKFRASASVPGNTRVKPQAVSLLLAQSHK